MTTHLFVVLAMALPTCLVIALYVWNRVRRVAALQHWADRNGFELRSYREPWLNELSGFPITVSKAQTVYWVEIETESGESKQGWVRLGSAWRGLNSAASAVRWVEDTEQDRIGGLMRRDR